VAIRSSGQVAAGMELLDKIRPGDVIERVTVWTGEALP
jgi:hypothetical protein